MTLPSDATPKTEEVLIELRRQTPVWRKLEMVGQLNAMAKTLALSSLRHQYPNVTEGELRWHLADRLLGPELAAAVYGPPSTSSDA